MIDKSLFTTSSLGSKTNESPAVTAGSWSAAYGDRHRLQRITVFPFGVTPPSKVRLYWRCDHYVLQWWDPGVKRTLSDRIDGDLVTALTRIREIETRLEVRGSSQAGRRRLSFAELLDRFLRDLHQRADADEIDVRTVRRADHALAYLRRFTVQSAIFAPRPPFYMAHLASGVTSRATWEGQQRSRRRHLTPHGTFYSIADAS